MLTRARISTNMLAKLANFGKIRDRSENKKREAKWQAKEVFKLFI